MLIIAAAVLLLISVVAFVYRKHLVETLIKSAAIVNPIGSAHAQSNVVVPPKPEPLVFPVLREGGASMIAQPGILGFELRGKVEEVPENCEVITSPFFLTSFALSDISDEDFYLRVNACLKRDLTGKKWVASFGPLQVPLTNSEKRIIEAIQKKIEGERELEALLDEEFLEMEFKKPSIVSHLASLIEKFESFDNLVSRISLVYIYSSLGNQGKAEELIRPYLEEIEFSNYFAQEYNYRDSQNLRRRLAQMLAGSRKNMGKSKVFDAFLLKIYGESSPNMRDMLDSEMDIPKGSRDAMKIAKSPILGPEFPLTWTWWAVENMKQKDRDAFFERVPVSSEAQNLQVLRYYVPFSNQRREGFADAMDKLPSKLHPEREALYFEIMKNEEWRKYLSSIPDKKIAPIFKAKRDFYTQTFSKNQGVLFSVYNLFQLGDFQREHFLKVFAIRTYGLPATQILPL